LVRDNVAQLRLPAGRPAAASPILPGREARCWPGTSCQRGRREGEQHATLVAGASWIGASGAGGSASLRRASFRVGTGTIRARPGLVVHGDPLPVIGTSSYRGGLDFLRGTEYAGGQGRPGMGTLPLLAGRHPGLPTSRRL